MRLSLRDAGRSPYQVGLPVSASVAIVESVKLPADDAIIFAYWILCPDSTRIEVYVADETFPGARMLTTN